MGQGTQSLDDRPKAIHDCLKVRISSRYARRYAPVERAEACPRLSRGWVATTVRTGNPGLSGSPALRVTHPAAITAIGDGLEKGDQIGVDAEINGGGLRSRASQTDWPWEQSGPQRRRQGWARQTFRRPCRSTQDNPLTHGAHVLRSVPPVAPLPCLAIPALPMQAHPGQNRFPCQRRQRRSRQPLLSLGSYWALIPKAFSRLPPAQ